MFKIVFLLSLFLVLSCTDKPDKSVEVVSDLPEISKLWNYRDPGASEQVFRKVLKDVDPSQNPGYYLILQTQIARTFGLRYNFENAHSLLDSIQDQLTDELPMVNVNYLLERGRAFNSSGRRNEAKPLFTEAFELAKSVGADYLAIDAAHMMGIAEPPVQQIEWNLKAMALAEQTEDERARAWLGPLYNNTGWSYHEIGDFNSALAYFEKSLAFRQEAGDEYGTFVGKWTIGRVYRSLERIDDALEIQLALEQETSEKELPPDGYVLEELGELYLIKKNPEKYQHYFKLAYQQLSQDQWLQDNEPDRLKRLLELSN